MKEDISNMDYPQFLPIYKSIIKNNNIETIDQKSIKSQKPILS